MFIALAGLSVVGIPFLTVMGLAAAGTVLVAVLIALTLLPALLSFAGYRVLRKRDRSTAVEAATEGEHVGAIDHTKRAGRWIRGITRRPLLVVIGVVALMGILSLPVLKLHLALPDEGTAASDTTKRQAYDLIADHFGPGVNGPLVVTVSGEPAAVTAAVPQVTAQLAALPNVLAAQPGAVSQDGTLAVVTVIPKTGPSDPATENLVHAIRDAAPAIQASTGTTIAVTGQTALAIDVSEKLGDALPVYLAIVVGLALILLLLVFRSLLVPIIAAAGFLLSIGVAFGAVIAVYQWGWLSAIFGVDTPAPIISFLPIILTGVLFGLAMDYQVFTVAGMREAHVHGAGPTEVGGRRVHRRRPGGGGRGDHHDQRVRRVHPGAGRDHRLDRFRAGSRCAGRRLPGPDDPGAGRDDPARQVRLVPAEVAGPDPAGRRHRGREVAWRSWPRPRTASTRASTVPTVRLDGADRLQPAPVPAGTESGSAPKHAAEPDPV